MIYYIYMVSVSYGKNNSCWRRDIKKMLIDKGYHLNSSIGKFFKVNTATKEVFGTNSCPTKYFSESTSFAVMERVF